MDVRGATNKKKETKERFPRLCSGKGEPSAVILDIDIFVHP
jgi:hypothetical protein